MTEESFFNFDKQMNDPDTLDARLGIQTEEIQHDGTDSYHFHRYEPTPYPVLDELFSHITLEPEDVVIDYGCGLGRLNFYLASRFHIRSIGIEMNPLYYDRAQENKTSCLSDDIRQLISFYPVQAEEYPVPAEATVFYFFNPFSVEIFRPVINQILLSWQNHPRKLTLILYYPEDDTIFYIENHTSFRLADEIAASDDIRKDRRERFCVYTFSTGLQ